MLWVQQRTRNGDIVVQKIDGTKNEADLMTKVLSLKEVMARLEGISIEMRGLRRSAEAAAPAAADLSNLKAKTLQMKR